MKFLIPRAAAAATVLAVLLSGCGGSSLATAQATGGTGGLPGGIRQASSPRLTQSQAARIQVPATGAPVNPNAAAYCTKTGGLVEIRRAVYGTNGPSTLQLAGVRGFCQYTLAKDGSRIHILLSTLYTREPTLAALAYILKPAIGTCQGNPASCYCSLLGGSDQFGGTTGAGGGWYLQNAIDQVLEACIFPDMSSIDSWGLTYHAAGIIRGINLTKVMRYKYKP